MVSPVLLLSIQNRLDSTRLDGHDVERRANKYCHRLSVVGRVAATATATATAGDGCMQRRAHKKGKAP
jgi:hypothetical protein